MRRLPLGGLGLRPTRRARAAAPPLEESGDPTRRVGDADAERSRPGLGDSEAGADAGSLAASGCECACDCWCARRRGADAAKATERPGDPLRPDAGPAPGAGAAAAAAGSGTLAELVSRFKPYTAATAARVRRGASASPAAATPAAEVLPPSSASLRLRSVDGETLSP